MSFLFKSTHQIEEIRKILILNQKGFIIIHYVFIGWLFRSKDFNFSEVFVVSNLYKLQFIIKFLTLLNRC
jgi:hypothetical protein